MGHPGNSIDFELAPAKGAGTTFLYDGSRVVVTTLDQVWRSVAELESYCQIPDDLAGLDLSRFQKTPEGTYVLKGGKVILTLYYRDSLDCWQGSLWHPCKEACASRMDVEDAMRAFDSYSGALTNGAHDPDAALKINVNACLVGLLDGDHPFPPDARVTKAMVDYLKESDTVVDLSGTTFNPAALRSYENLLYATRMGYRDPKAAEDYLRRARLLQGKLPPEEGKSLTIWDNLLDS